MATANRKARAREPEQWYVEPRWAADSLVQHLLPELRGCVVYDPCCGGGTMLDAAAAAGLPTVGSDIVRRGADRRHAFAQGDFLKMRRLPFSTGHGTAILSNTPYGKEGEIMVRHALTLPFRLAAFIFPLSFMASVNRYALWRDHPPSRWLVYSERPTMPPGRLIGQMATAFEGGQIDYGCLVYERDYQGPTLLQFIKPRDVA